MHRGRRANLFIQNIVLMGFPPASRQSIATIVDQCECAYFSHKRPNSQITKFVISGNSTNKNS